MTERKRTQLNLRFDGKDDLVEALKSAAQTRGESLNAYCARVLAESIGMSSGNASTASTVPTYNVSASSPVSSEVLDKIVGTKVESLLAERLGGIEERLGKLRA